MRHKVLYVSHNPMFQGAVLSLYTLVRALDREAFEPEAAFSKHGPMYDRLRSEGVLCHVLSDRGLLNHGLVLQARRLIKRGHIDIVHLNNAVPFNKYVGIAARLAGAKLLWHVREPTGDKKMRRIGPWVRLLADRIVCVNTEQERYFGPTGKVVRVYNGVDTAEYSPDVDGGAYRSKAGFGPDDLVFGLVGTIEPRKGTMSFLRAAESVMDIEGARFMLVGSGMKEYEDEVAGFLDERPALRERTYLAGRIEDVPSAMASIDVLVMPSLWEGFPRSLIESMSAGIPAIASSVGEVPVIVDDGVTGLTIPPDDEEALCGAMRKLADMGAGARARMGAAARDKAVREYNISAHAGKIMEIYRELLGYGERA